MSKLNIVKEVPFKNWTATDFTHNYGGESYTFAKGGTYSIPSDIALHFAKHLAIRELHAQADKARAEAKADKRSSDEIVQAAAAFEALPENLMKEYQENCFPAKDKAQGASGSFERIDIKDTNASEAKPIVENKTVKDEQKETSEDDDADASDDKNNAGAPLIKGLAKRGRPAKSKDAEYVK
jgi:hypothetical protein